MRTAYIIMYDICAPERLRAVYKTMRGFGDRIQYSVFRCELSEAEIVLLEAALTPLLHHGEDQIVIVPLGPPGGRNDKQIYALGRPYVEQEKRIVVI